ncbi:PD-(D/E)XK nuclease family protein [Streptomyces sp. DH12]|uniref:PD-(D/E)XK nuclease family protein n=1 Tax=Streptomyces sp. DH12 TaxID=2857010 RepID=UPI001E43EE7E|nr:PD-(D/E)XK nuclease family protein [Streptomyces sp. DH12]
MAGVATIKRGSSRFYIDPGDADVKVPGVTSVVGMLPKDFLTFWAAKQSAEAAVTNWDIVSQLIKRDEAGAIDYLKGAHRRTSKAATDLGSAAHDLFERLARGEEVKDRHVHSDVRQHVRHFREFLDEVQPRFLHLEETVWSDTHQYAGSFDAIAEIDGGLVIVDWKTSKAIYDSVALQLSAYRYADRIIRASDGESIPVPDVMGGAALHVRPEGWSLHPVDCGPQVFEAFCALRRVFDWESEGKKRVIRKPVASGGEFVSGTQRRAA